MDTHYVTSKDGTRIAYDVTGQGPALVLLHGAGMTRGKWQATGYVDRLKDNFRVITPDIRGTGESDFCTEIGDYEIDKLIHDVHAIADECSIAEFMVYGYSLGGHIARYMGAFSDRVLAVVCVGVPFGAAIDEQFGVYINKMLEKWQPIVSAYKSGILQGEELAQIRKLGIPVWAACFQAMRSWPKVDPSDLRCPTLQLAGGRNTPVVEWIAANQDVIVQSSLRTITIDGLDHTMEFSEIDQVLPPIVEFLEAAYHDRFIHLAT